MIARLALVVPLAWRNVWRAPRRTVLSMASIALAAAVLVFILSFELSIYATMKENTLRIFDGYAQIQPAGYLADPELDRTIADPGKIVREALAVDGVTAAAPRVNAFAILANGQRSYGAGVIGVDPPNERKVSSIARTVREGRYLAAADTDSAVLGEALARNLQLQVGMKVTVLGAARDGSVASDVLTVVGIIRSGIPVFDRSILEMPLSRARETFGMDGRTNTIALGGPSLKTVNGALRNLRAVAQRNGAVVVDWKAMEPALNQAIALDFTIGMLMYAMLIAVVAFIILNTLLMSVLERTREFGTMLAMGMRPVLIGRMVWIELICLALIGCALGVAIGGVVTLYYQHTGLEFADMGELLQRFGLPPRIYPNLTFTTALIGPAAILLSIVVGGIVPYLRAVRLTAAAAMRAT